MVFINSRLSYSYSETSLQSFILSLNALFVILKKCNNIALLRDVTSISHEVYFVVNQITSKLKMPQKKRTLDAIACHLSIYCDKIKR